MFQTLLFKLLPVPWGCISIQRLEEGLEGSFTSKWAECQPDSVDSGLWRVTWEASFCLYGVWSPQRPKVLKKMLWRKCRACFWSSGWGQHWGNSSFSLRAWTFSVRNRGCDQLCHTLGNFPRFVHRVLLLGGTESNLSTSANCSVAYGKWLTTLEFESYFICFLGNHNGDCGIEWWGGRSFWNEGSFWTVLIFSNKKSAGRCWKRAALDLLKMFRVVFSLLAFHEEILEISTWLFVSPVLSRMYLALP